MGTSKITLISGVYIILGLYTFAFNNSDETTSTLAYSAGKQTQAEQLANTGVSLALVKLANYNPSYYYSRTHFSTKTSTGLKGTVTYNATVESGLSSDERQIVATGTLNGTTVTVTAIVHYDTGRWRVERTFIS